MAAHAKAVSVSMSPSEIRSILDTIDFYTNNILNGDNLMAIKLKLLVELKRAEIKETLR